MGYCAIMTAQSFPRSNFGKAFECIRRKAYGFFLASLDALPGVVGGARSQGGYPGQSLKLAFTLSS